MRNQCVVTIEAESSDVQEQENILDQQVQNWEMENRTRRPVTRICLQDGVAEP